MTLPPLSAAPHPSGFACHLPRPLRGRKGRGASRNHSASEEREEPCPCDLMKGRSRIPAQLRRELSFCGKHIPCREANSFPRGGILERSKVFIRGSTRAFAVNRERHLQVSQGCLFLTGFLQAFNGLFNIKGVEGKIGDAHGAGIGLLVNLLAVLAGAVVPVAVDIAGPV